MKKIYSVKFLRFSKPVLVIFFLICAFSNLKAQMVYLPDTNFRAKLTSLGLGACIVGDSIDSSCPAVALRLNLNVHSSSIYDLQGIQAFTSLQSLDCSYDSLTYLPPLPNSLTSLNCYMNKLTMLPALPDSLTSLICSSNQLTTLPAIPNSLTDLSCGYNQLGSLPAFPLTLTYLECSSNPLMNLPSLPDSLTLLSCGLCQLTSLPALPVRLDNLSCARNALTGLPALPGNLRYLLCHFNQLTSLPVLPASLEIISCQNNQLTSLPALPDSLRYLSCDSNQLTSLPALPDSLKSLACPYNQLTSLPQLPNSLYYLRCPHNNLNTLPTLPLSLEFLHCYNNQLTSLPSLPISLEILFCDNNQLVSLPSLPNLLHVLGCSNNQLASLPPLNNSLYVLSCSANPLTSLPELPDSMWVLDCGSNPGLICLPRLKIIYNLNFDSTAVTCLPNYGKVYYSFPPLDSLPLCGLFNPGGCNVLWNISGKTFFDRNEDCHYDYDSLDVQQSNLHLMLYRNNSLIQQTFTGGSGFYSFDTDSLGPYEVKLDTTNIPFTALCPVSVNYNDTVTATDSLFYSNDFSLKCRTGFDVGALSIVAANRFLPAHYTALHINAGDIANFFRAHCAMGVSGNVIVTLNGPVHYVSSPRIPDSISGSVITYNVSDYDSVSFFYSFNMTVQTDTTAMIGSQICVAVSVTPLSGDNDTSNNSLTHCFTVVGSFDPNEKEVNPVGDMDPAGNRWLTYTIHFQNTGTAPAEHIYITDTLDANLDVSTFQLLAYSHQPLVQILEGGVARFNFPNINLPDSNSNEPASHGYIQYKIKLNNGLPLGSQIQNTAYIYFDFNSPVVTNTTLNTLVLPTAIHSIANIGSQFSVFPNPAHSEFTVYCLQFSSERKIHLKVFDIIGKELLSTTMRNARCQLQTAELPSGIYFLRIETVDGITIKKLVKE